MDPRVAKHAEILATHSTTIDRGDAVLIIAPHSAADLVVALHKEIAQHGATSMVVTRNDRAKRTYLQHAGELQTEPHLLAAMEQSDVVINVRAADNTYEMSDIAPETRSEYDSAQQPIRETRLAKRWVTTQYPTPADAQAASTSMAAYQDFVWNAIIRDWEKQGSHQEQLVELLDAATTIRIVSGDETDITMSVNGMEVVNDYGQHNMPGGEVSTAPVLTSVNGIITFDKPLMAYGREVTNISLTFEDGVVVESAAERNEDVLDAVLNTDEGARRIGELGIGMNRAIDQFSYNMLFDEKMGDTVHLALGQAYEQTVGPNRTRNDSAIHMDMIVDMQTDSFIEFDGEIVQQDGAFIFESGSELPTRRKNLD